MIEQVTDASFNQEVLQSTTPVVVDFWAPWCAPCKSLMATLESIAPDYADKVKIVKVNIDEETVGMTRGVRGVPTLMAFKDGNVVATKVGAMPRSALEEFLNQL